MSSPNRLGSPIALPNDRTSPARSETEKPNRISRANSENMSDNEASGLNNDGGEPVEAPPNSEHLNIKVTDNSNEVFFKIKRSTQLKKLMDAFCDRQGKSPQSVRFLYDGQRVQPHDSPDSVSPYQEPSTYLSPDYSSLPPSVPDLEKISSDL
jgi:hypothetical protein